MGSSLQQRYSAYVEPIWYIGLGIQGFFSVIVHFMFDNPRQLLDISRVKYAVFAEFWARVGPMFEDNDKNTAVPALASLASGVVLELGPGTGSQLRHFQKSEIQKIYGVEPNLDLHAALRKNIQENGLQDIYEVVPHGVEDVDTLRKYGVFPKSVDTVLSVQVLCSVPQLDNTMRQVHDLLKPGGRLIVYEHVRSSDWVTLFVQDMYTIVWPFFVGNCHLNCNIYKSIMNAGGWEMVELTLPDTKETWNVFPRIWGHLRK